MKAPTIDLEWEVGLFNAARAIWKRLRPEPPLPWDPARVVHLEDHQRRLTVLAQILSGAPVRVMPARTCGGVRGRDFLLPSYIDLAPNREGNLALYRLRIAFSSAIYRLDPGMPPDVRWEQVLWELKVVHDARALLSEELAQFDGLHREACAWVLATRPPLEDFRGLERLLEEARRAALAGERPWEDAELRDRLARGRGKGPQSPGIPIWGGLIRVEDEESGLLEAQDETDAPPPAGTEREAPVVEEIHRVFLSERDAEASVLTHTFEKVETADSYSGGARDTDGDDVLDEHLEALSEVDLSEVIRGGDQAQSIYRADIQLDVDVPDVATIGAEERGVVYDEWDWRTKRYREGWCTVYPTPMQGGMPAWGEAARVRHHGLIQALRRRLEQHRARLQPLDRQLEGEDVDIAAMVDEYAARRGGHGGSQRLYIRQERQRRDYATTVLIDVSLSTDGWVDNRRVLDVAREAVLVLGEVAEALGDQLQVLAFASHTRNRCRVWEVRGWEEPWVVGRARLGLLRPQGYTRIGPAIRHATAMLDRAPAERRLLLLISDGKPSDYDRYEGMYGVRDVRQALREAEQRGIVAHALAVESGARDYLPPMFGPGAWHVLPAPESLPEVLGQVYGRLTGGR